MSKDVTKLLYKYKAKYFNYGSIWCPVLKENVLFTGSGWKHFRFKGNGRKRKTEEITTRLNLIPCIPPVIKYSSQPIIDQIESNKDGKSIKFTFYELPFRLNKGKKIISVILRKVNDGKLHYYSVRFTSNKIKKALQGLI